MADAYRHLALAHPGSFRFVLSHQYSNPTTVRPTAYVLDALRDAGIAEADRVHLLRFLVAYLGGAIARELGSPGQTPTGAVLAGGHARRPVAAAAAAAVEKAPGLVTVDHAAEYAFGVDFVLDGIEAKARSAR